MLLVTHSLDNHSISIAPISAAKRALLRVSARVVAVEVLVHVEDEVSDGAVGVRDPQERGAGSIRHEGLGRGPVVPGKKDDLRSRAAMG